MIFRIILIDIDSASGHSVECSATGSGAVTVNGCFTSTLETSWTGGRPRRPQKCAFGHSSEGGKPLSVSSGLYLFKIPSLLCWVSVQAVSLPTMDGFRVA